MKPKHLAWRWIFTLGIASLLLLAARWNSRAGDPEPPATNNIVVADLKPLQLPDNSSPRDTLLTFLKNTDDLTGAWLRNMLDDSSDRALISALMAMDFSATPDGDAWSVQTERMVLLKEILDRMELPPENEIPGDEEVARDNLTHWNLPDTVIALNRVDSGLRAGQFLFSAGTVVRLPRLYGLVKDLPYQRPESTTGLYEAYIESDRTIFSFENELRIRLRRVDTSSPRSTLLRFLENVNRAHQLVMEADKALGTKPPAMTRQQALELERTADDHLQRAAATLDLSRVPGAHRKAASLEAVFKLKEILDRTVPPWMDTIPDATMVSQARQQASQSSLPTAGPFRWKYPNTEIEIAEIMEGDQQGRFLFTAATVGQIDEFYTAIHELPYRTDLPRSVLSRYAYSPVSPGFYDFVFTNPGYLVPRASWLGRLVLALPDGFRTVYGGQTVWQWLGLLACMLTVGFAAWAIFRGLKLLAGRLRPPLDGWLMTLAPALLMVVMMAVYRMIDRDFNVTGLIRTAVTTLAKGTIILMLIWVAIRLCKAIAETVITSPKIQERSLDASLLRITMRLAAFVIGGWIIIVSVREFGADLVPLLAGLGVGGLAVALAAQRTFANFIGSLILFVNKPVKPGDFCRYGDQIGTVEHIGLLATRIRSLERSIVTVPNAEFSEMKLDNFAMRDQRLLKTVLQLRYETTPDQMRYILAKLRELLLRHPKVSPDPARVRFVGYNDYSKDVEIFAYLLCQAQNEFLAIQEDVLMRMEDIVLEAGSGFAFPSQTAYLSRDSGLDTKRGAAARTQVQQWRGSGRFPFPEHAETERAQLKDTLDYPPKGSPDFEPPKTSFHWPTDRGSPLFSAEDFVDLPSFTAKLQQTNQIADFLWGRLSVKTQELLSNYSAEIDAEVRECLVQDLNAILQGPSIYAVDRFSQIQRRQETQALLDSQPEGEILVRLNRLLLEDAYPHELASTLEKTAPAKPPPGQAPPPK